MAYHSYQHAPDNERRLLWAMLLIGGFMVVEAIGGWLSGSLALLADAGHMLTDTASLLMAWLAARTARRPADSLRTYGYHRIQILAALFNGVGFIVLVGWIAFEAVQRLMEPVEVLGGMMLVVAVVGFLVNILAFVLLHGGNGHDLNMKGALVHVLGDLLGSVAAITAAGIILLTGWIPIDPLLSLLVGLLILRSAWYVVRHSTHILLEGTPEHVDVEVLQRVLTEAVPEVEELHHIHVWSLTPERPMLTMHARVAKGTDTATVLGQLKRILTERFGIHHSTIQVEPQCFDEPPPAGCDG